MPRPVSLRHGMLEAAIVGGFCVVTALAIFITYSRFPAEDFYSVSESGVAAAAGRMIVSLNFPIAFIAIALLAITVSSMLAAAWHPREVSAAAIVAAALCLVAAAPGVVQESDLDVKWINAVPAIGVAITAILMALAIRENGIGPIAPWSRADTIASVFGGIFVLAGLPWIWAQLGFYMDNVPLLGRIFLSKGDENGPGEAYVHLGDHHGTSGLLLLICALVLRRVIGLIEPRWLDRALSGYVAFMAAYGIANAIQDGWHEQIVKRGWSGYDIPNATVPSINWVWGAMVLGAVIAWLLMFRATASPRNA